MFEPLFDNASITVCGAYCAIMEFKRACRLPFTTIDMLLKLLQLLCPPNNHLPQSIYKFKTFFEKFSSSHQKQQFCSDCKTEFRENQSKCDNLSCRHVEPSTLISFNGDIPSVLKINHLRYPYSFLILVEDLIELSIWAIQLYEMIYCCSLGWRIQTTHGLFL